MMNDEQFRILKEGIESLNRRMEALEDQMVRVARLEVVQSERDRDLKEVADGVRWIGESLEELEASLGSFRRPSVSAETESRTPTRFGWF